MNQQIIDQNDPVDLIIEGKIEEAIEAYVNLYVEILDEHDFNFCQYLVIQLYMCLVIKYKGQVPEDFCRMIEHLITAKFNQHSKLMYLHIIKDDIEGASQYIKTEREKLKIRESEN